MSPKTSAFSGQASTQAGICPFASRSGHIHHCDCNAVPGMLAFGEARDVAGLIAPRRLLLVHGSDDPLFPREEVDRAVDGLRRIFAAADAGDALAHVVCEGGHRFYKEPIWAFVAESLG